jgi:hypothetical protein
MAKYYDQDSNFIYEADDVREAPGAPEIPTPETPRESSFTNRPPDEWNKGAKFIDIEPGKSGRYTEMGVGDYVEPTQPTKKETFPTKPSETSMKMMDEYGKFRDFVIKNQFDGKTPDELRKEYIKNVTKTHGSSTTDAHLFDAVKQEADKIYNRANTELQHHLSMFTEQYKENLKHQRNRQEKLEDQAIAKSEKYDAEQKEKLKTVKDDMKSLEKQIKEIESINPVLLQNEMYAPQARKLPLLKQEHADLKQERDSIINRGEKATWGTHYENIGKLGKASLGVDYLLKNGLVQSRQEAINLIKDAMKKGYIR